MGCVRIAWYCVKMLTSFSLQVVELYKQVKTNNSQRYNVAVVPFYEKFRDLNEHFCILEKTYPSSAQFSADTLGTSSRSL